MSVWTSTVMMKPPKVDCDSASAKTRLVSASASAPPCSLGVHQAEQAGVAELSQHLARRHAGLLPGERVRLDLARDEARDLLAQQLVLGREVDALHRRRRAAVSANSVASVQPSARTSAARRCASLGIRNSSSCGGATAVPASIACAWPRWCTWWLSRWAMTWPRRSRWIRPSPRSISTIVVERRRRRARRRGR